MRRSRLRSLRSGAARYRVFGLAAALALLTPVSIAGLATPAAAAQGDIYTIAGNGKGVYNGDDILATGAQIRPGSVAIDAHRNPLLVDTGHNRLRVIAVSASDPGYRLAGCHGACTWTVGNIYTIAGIGTLGYNGGDGAPATSAQLQHPSGIAIDTDGNPLFGDADNNRVRVIAVSASNPGYLLSGCIGPCTWSVGDIYTIAGGTYGYSGDGDAAASAQLAHPNYLALDPDGNVVVFDAFNVRVRVVAVSASNPGYVLGGCTGPCTWTVGNIYTIAGGGNYDYNGDGIPATTAGFSVPTGVAVDSHGNPLTSESNNSRVRVVAVSASNPGYLLGGCTGPCTWTVGNIYTIAGKGIFRHRGDGGPSTSADLNHPLGVSIDPHGNPIISEGPSFRVRAIAVSASNPGYLLAGCHGPCKPWTVGNIYTIAGNGAAGFRGDGGLATNARLYVPSGTASDTEGNLYIVDAYNLRIRQVVVAETAPDAPRSVSATPGYTRATVTWSAPASDGGHAVTGYVVTPYVGHAAQTPSVINSTANRAVVTGLSNAASYTFTVAAMNSLGTGTPSQPAAAITIGSRPGYRLLTGDGGVFAFREGFFGSPASDPKKCARNVVDRALPNGTCFAMAATPDGRGYWVLNGDTGAIYAYGNAHLYGQVADEFAGVSREFVPAGKAIVSTPSGKGYWVLEAGLSGTGSIFHFGDAGFFGDTTSIARKTGVPFNAAPVGMAATPDGQGYWEVHSDGGVFAFGRARFYGSAGAIHLNSPIVGMATTTTGKGYWLVASDGGVFAFGDAVYAGSMGGVNLNRPIVGIARNPYRPGYWLVASDGGIFAFGGAPFLGSTGGMHLNRPVFAIAAS